MKRAMLLVVTGFVLLSVALPKAWAVSVSVGTVYAAPGSFAYIPVQIQNPDRFNMVGYDIHVYAPHIPSYVDYVRAFGSGYILGGGNSTELENYFGPNPFPFSGTIATLEYFVSSSAPSGTFVPFGAWGNVYYTNTNFVGVSGSIGGIQIIPEPSSLALVSTALCLGAFVWRRRGKQKAWHPFSVVKGDSL